MIAKRTYDTYFICSVDLCSSIKKLLHHRKMTILCRPMKRSVSVLNIRRVSRMITKRRNDTHIIWFVDLCSSIKQLFHHRKMTTRCRQNKRIVSVLKMEGVSQIPSLRLRKRRNNHSTEKREELRAQSNPSTSPGSPGKSGVVSSGSQHKGLDLIPQKLGKTRVQYVRNLEHICATKIQTVFSKIGAALKPERAGITSASADIISRL